MASKGSTADLIPATKQDEIRRNAKRSKKSRAKGLHTDTYTAGIEQDRLHKEAKLLLDWLDVKMVSSSPKDHRIIRDAFVVMMQNFVDADKSTLSKMRVYRIEYAIDQALKQVASDRLAKWFRYTAKAVHRAVRQHMQGARAA